MKVEIKETETKFEPITITLTIESEEELIDLHLRASIPSYNVDEFCEKTKFKAMPNTSAIRNCFINILKNKGLLND